MFVFARKKSQNISSRFTGHPRQRKEAGRKLHFLTSLLLVLNYYKDNVENQ